jgi:hypothetical protein
MVSKILVMYIMIAVISFSVSVVYFQQQNQIKNDSQIAEVDFDSIEWNNEVTRILPRGGELGEKWVLFWSESSEEFVQGEPPTITRKIIDENEILTTSYNYAHTDYGKYQILIWKSELVSNLIPKDTVENILSQRDAKIKKIIDDKNLNSDCTIGYYDYYAEGMQVKNDLLFSECGKDDYRITINFIGKYDQSAIDTLIFLSNSAVGKI